MLRRESLHVQTPAVLMIVWCSAVELASYPLGCTEGVFHDLLLLGNSEPFSPIGFKRTSSRGRGTYLGSC